MQHFQGLLGMTLCEVIYDNVRMGSFLIHSAWLIPTFAKTLQQMQTKHWTLVGTRIHI